MSTTEPATSPATKTAVVVSGMHRSGTSALTRMLSFVGAGLPENLIEGRPDDNERGFWEGRRVVDLNQQIITDAGSWWGGWQAIRHTPDEHARLVGEAATVIREEYSGSDLLVMKDPRVSRLLPIWTDALEQEGYRTTHVVCLRNPAHAAGSLARRNGLDAKVSTLSWLAHMLDAELFTRAQPRVFVAFGHLLTRWRIEAERISQTLDITWPVAYDDVAAEVGEFLEPSLAHAEGAVPPEVRQVYRIMRRWAEDDVRPGDAAIMDDWRSRFDVVRTASSPTSLIAERRQRAIADFRADKDSGKAPQPGSPQVWTPLINDAYNVEGASAWEWLETVTPAEHPLAGSRHVVGATVPPPPVPARSTLARVRGRLGRAKRALLDRPAPATPAVVEPVGTAAVVAPDATREPVEARESAEAQEPATTNLGPAMDAAIAQARRLHRPRGVDPDYDLVREHFDVPLYLLHAKDALTAPLSDPIGSYLAEGPMAKANPDVNFSTRGYVTHYPERTVGRDHPYVAWLKRGRAAGEIADPAPGIQEMAGVLGLSTAEVVERLSAERSSLRDRMVAGTLGEMFAKAAEIEPMIGDAWAEIARPKLAPFTNPGVVQQVAALHQCQEAAGHRRARLVFVINRPRWGGGRRVEGHLAHALQSVVDPADIVVIHTDEGGASPEGRYPEGVREIDFAGATTGLSSELRQRTLVELIRSLRAETLININSKLLYEALTPYGTVLTSDQRVFLMYFCNEQTARGTWVGYPMRTFYRHFEKVAGVVCDSHFLIDWLQERHLFPDAYAERMHVFAAPVDGSLPVAVRDPAAGKGARPQVFWAGRWDRQKRIDLVLQIARQLPDVDFRLWGEEVLDGPDFGAVPANVTLEGRYAHITDLELGRADAWLYTSAWDGVPSQLLEVAMTGVPIVGTLVGGTGELLDPDLSWPIPETEGADAYEQALRAILADPEQARSKALALRERLLEERTEQAYAEHAARVLFGEVGTDEH
ncbi:MAG TPA: glycosyltransferase [Marmoricola sp.]